ncbi:maltose ABC transporter permease MalG, partial [Escherichia coli]|nr:maltose ABC transporter permease MalG [Escherichia coli]
MHYRLASPTKSNPIRSRIIQCPPGFFRTSSESIH